MAHLAARRDSTALGSFSFLGRILSALSRRIAINSVVPVLEPRDHIPQDLRVIEYPWGSSDCADPFAVLMDMIRKEQKG